MTGEWLGWSLLVTLVACGGAAPESTPPTAAPSPGARGGAHAATARLPDDPVEAARALMALARSSASEIDAYVDHRFQRALSLAGTGEPVPDEVAPTPTGLGALLVDLPEGCVPTLTASGGYESVAIAPPTVDHTDAQAAEIDAIIDALRAGTEVVASCEVTEAWDDEDGRHEQRVEVSVLAIAIAADDALGWRVLGWRDLRERGGP